MGQTLTNGIYLPNEGERNCYSGLAANWNAVDTLKGNYSLHAINVDIHVTAAEKETWNSKADNSALTAHTGDTTIHVTSADKQAWNGKADASALTAHTGNTTIHVTAEDKAAWNGKADASALTAHTGDTTIHVTAEDKAKWDAVTSKADDIAVVHNTGNETIDGNKSLLKNLKIKNKDVTRGSTTGGGTRSITFTDSADNELGSVSVNKFSNGTSSLALKVSTTDNTDALISSSAQFYITKTGTKAFTPVVDGDIDLGRSSYKWSDVQTYKVNNLEPSSLGMPSGNARDVIDISSYLTNLAGPDNTYVAPANGWITIKAGTATGISCTIPNLWNDSRIRTSAGGLKMLFPVLKGQTVYISIYATTIDMARFIPCQGNV